MSKMGKRFYILLAAFAVAIFTLTAVNKQQVNAAETKSKDIHVVASVDFYGDVAKAVLGDQGTVTSLINSPSVDPHDFEPTTKDGKQVAKADVVLSNGVGYDNWLHKLAKGNGDKHQTEIRVGEDVLHKKVGANEHLWYQPQTMPKLANALAKKFAKLDPKNKAKYEQNAKKYIDGLKPLNDQIDKLKKGHKDGAKVDVSEPVFDYALDATGYQRNNKSFELAVENGTDPSPKDIKKLRADITGKKIAFFVNNKQASDKTVAALVKLAKKNDVPVLNVTETLPKGKTYETWMKDQYDQLGKIQQMNQK